MADDDDQDSGPSFGQAVSDIVRQPTLGGVLQSVAGAGVLGAKKAYNALTDLAHYDFQPVDHDPFQDEQPSVPAAGEVDPTGAYANAEPGAALIKAAAAMPEGMTQLVTTPGKLSSEVADINKKITDQGYMTEEDAARLNIASGNEHKWGRDLAEQMVAGGPGAAEEGAAGIAGGKLKQPDDVHPAWIDTRYPTAKNPIPSEGPQIVNREAMEQTPELYKNNVDLTRDYPGVKIPSRASTDTAADAFTDHVKNNLLWLYDKVPDEIKARSSQWYDGGNKIVNDWAQKYGTDDSTVAGVIAATSPQKDWYNNVSIAQRILDQTKGDPAFYEGHVMTPEMEKSFENTPSLAKMAPVLDEIKGKSLADIDQILPYPKDERDVYKALWIRLYDQAHNDPGVRIVSPEGQILPKISQNVAWGSIPEISKAVNIIDNPGQAGDLVGMRHKVRNFYNNLLDPNSPRGDVTIDTHAVAAGLLRPLSGKSPEVSHNFGNWPGKDIPSASNSAKTGIWGTYPLYADAYREAAQERGILPRQLQSVTWEAVRGLFPEDWKNPKNSAIIDNIWRQYKSGQRGIDETRQRIFDAAGGIKQPSWYQPFGRSGTGNAAGTGASNSADLFEPRIYGESAPSFVTRGRSGSPAGPSAPVGDRNISYELDFGAGAPYNERFPDWAGLSGDQKAKIASSVLPQITDFAKQLSGANEYARVYGLGGWHEFTNPAYKSKLVATPDQAGDFANTLGYLAQQTKIFGYRAAPDGEGVGIALHGGNLGDPAKVQAFWKDLNEQYPDFASGFSPSRDGAGRPGIEIILDKGGKEMAQRVKDELMPALNRLFDRNKLGDVDVRDFRSVEESKEHDWSKDPSGSGYLQGLSTRHGPDVQRRLDLFRRQQLEPELDRQIQGAVGGRGGDRGSSLEEASGAPAVPLKAAAKPVTLGSGSTAEESKYTAALAAAQHAAAGREPLAGLPRDNITMAGQPFVPGPVGYVHDVAEKYMRDANLSYDPPKTFAKVDQDRGSRISDAFENMKHDPDNPAVAKSYQAMIDETLAQYRALKQAGVKFELIKPGQPDPYAESPRLAAKDVIDNKHLWVFPTDEGFGGPDAGLKGNPMLQHVDEHIDGKQLRANDVFRIVHDMFGHLKDGNGFRASGEENAWRAHSAMYSDAARPAMTTETRGQNSWVNYGPHGEANRKATAGDTRYADQKVGLLPDWVSNEGRGDAAAVKPVDNDPFNETLYHGTSKDKDFKSFKNSRNGTWFTTDPKEASQYAVQNDSQNLKYDPSSSKFVRTNTASRIIPMKHSFQNTLELNDWPKDLREASNYKRAFGNFMDKARSQGYDSVRMRGENGHSLVVSLDNSKLRSAYNSNKFAAGGIVAPAAEAIGDIADSGIPQSIASYISGYAQNQWDRIKEDNFNPFSTKSNDIRNWQQQRAHGGRVEPLNINQAPTEAQKSAGNYAKDHLSFQGLPITVENAKGSMRRGVGPGGKSWECVIPAHYGYIKGTEGRDGDHVDVYIGPHGKSPYVFVVDQVNHETKRFDEHKVMLGFGSKTQAITTYKRAFSDGKGYARIGKVHEITMAQFKDWLSRGDTMKRFIVSKSEPDIKLPEGYTVEYAEGFGWSLYDPHGVMLGTGEERNDAARHLKNQKVIVLQPLKARAA